MGKDETVTILRSDLITLTAMAGALASTRSVGVVAYEVLGRAKLAIDAAYETEKREFSNASAAARIRAEQIANLKEILND